MTAFTSARPEDLLFDAARKGDVPYLQEVLAAGVDINTTDGRGFTALILATYEGHAAAAEALLAACADVNVQDRSGNTALMGVCFKGYDEIARSLIAHGADLDRQNGNGGTALMFATLFGRNELVRTVLAAGGRYAAARRARPDRARPGLSARQRSRYSTPAGRSFRWVNNLMRIC